MEEPGTGAGSSTNFRFAPLRKFPADDYSSIFRPPESPKEPMEFLARSWSISALEVSKALSSTSPQRSNTNNGVSTSSAGAILEELTEEPEDQVVAAGNPFSFASSTTSQLVMERIMSQSQEVSPLTSGRLSHSSGPLNGQSCGSFTDSPPVSPSEIDDTKLCRLTNTVKEQNTGKTVGRWLKDRKEKKKEEARAHNAQVHASVSVAGVAAAVAAIAAATASSGKNEQQSKTDLAVASAATLVAAQCVEVAESMGAERELLTAVVNSAVNVRTSGDIMTLTAAAATALRGAAILKARALKGVWNVAAVLPAEKGMGTGNQAGSFSGELIPGDNFLGVASQGFLAKGSELLKRTRNGDLHWKLVSVYLNRLGQVMLKMKSRYAAGTIKNKKKFAIIEVCKDIQAWPGRHLVEGGEQRRYFGLKTAARRVIEFECKNQREYDIWTQGVSRLISLANEKNRPT